MAPHGITFHSAHRSPGPAQATDGLHVYAHCGATKGGHDGKVALAFVNIEPNASFTLRLDAKRPLIMPDAVSYSPSQMRLRRAAREPWTAPEKSFVPIRCVSRGFWQNVLNM